MLSAISLLVGLTVDLGLAQSERRKQQEAADAAALAAAAELARGRSVADASALATSVVARYGYTNGVNNVSVTAGTPTAGAYARDARYLEVTISRSTTNLFARLGALQSVRASARSVAGLVPGPRRCLMALDESAAEVFSVQGAAQISTTGCGIMVNSGSATAFRADAGTSVAVSADIGVTGGTINGSGIPVNSAAPREPDPMGYIPNPTGLSNSCTYNDVVVTATTTLLPGVYCAIATDYALDVRSTATGTTGSGSLGPGRGTANGGSNGSDANNGKDDQVGGGGTPISGSALTMQPGRYVIRGGLRMAGASTIVNALDVTFIVTAKPSGTFVPVMFGTDARLSFSAPSSTTGNGIPGVLLYVDRTVTSNATHLIQNLGSSYFVGALYFPRHAVAVSDATTGRTISVSGGVVARALTVSGNAKLAVTAPTTSDAALRRIAVAN